MTAETRKQADVGGADAGGVVQMLVGCILETHGYIPTIDL